MFFEKSRTAASFCYNGAYVPLAPAEMTKKTDGVYEKTLPDGLTAILETAAPGAYWQRLRFEHRGKENSGVLSEICALDASEKTAGAVLWESLKGDCCGAESFAPLKKSLAAGQTLRVEPYGGRPSDTTGFPFFDIALNGEAATFGIGWGGQWFLLLERMNEETRLRVGLAEAETFLYPGESITAPEALWMHAGDIPAARRAFRRLLLEKYSPRGANGGYVKLPIALSCFDRYNGRLPFWATAEGQKRCVEIAAACGMDTHWLDAAWFKGGFPNGVGNYTYAEGFPNGVGGIGAYAHEKGLRFVQWFEPERANCYSETAKKHPRDVIEPPEKNSVNCLVNVGDPAVRRRVTDLLKERIADGLLDVYRQDFNMAPLEYWRSNDAPGRRGITEIRFVEGNRAMWDELQSAFPALLIDNCASGGRRLELGATRRAVPLWRSDTGCFPVDEKNRGHIWAQNQILALTRYLPYHSSGVWELTPYRVRSVFAGGTVFNLDVFAPGFSCEAARPITQELKRLQKYWTGDFYPLTEPTNAEDTWAAWQLTLENGGMVCAFRRDKCETPAFAPGLKKIREESVYEVTLTDENLQSQTRRLTGSALRKFTFTCPQAAMSVVLEYKELADASQ